MKKLITAILILALLLPAAALADNRDPIVGTWYVCFDIKGSPMESSFPDFVTTVMLFTFSESNDISYIELDYTDTSVTPSTRIVAGKWEKTGNEYKTSIIGAGVNIAKLNGDKLEACVIGSDRYIVLRRMTYLDMYNEIYTGK